jgi:uncharacterized protein YndB with AHSA1/START domain
MARILNAPRSVVFEAFTRPELVRRWLLGPAGWTMPVCDIDLRPGGSYRYVWDGPEGRQMGMRGVFREVVPPERCVQSETFDEPWYAGEAVVTTTLVEQDNKTKVTIAVRYESREIRDSVLKSNMTKGVSESFDRLAEVVEPIASGLDLEGGAVKED